MAPTRRIDEIGSGMPFEEIYSTVLSKLFILPGMAEINIAEIDNLEKKSKKDLKLLFLKKEFFIILLYEKNFMCLIDTLLVRNTFKFFSKRFSSINRNLFN